MRNSPPWPQSRTRSATTRGGHLLADYAANESAQMTQLHETAGLEYRLCASALSPRFRHYYDHRQGGSRTNSISETKERSFGKQGLMIRNYIAREETRLRGAEQGRRPRLQIAGQ
jgi:hypothetical protein